MSIKLRTMLQAFCLSIKSGNWFGAMNLTAISLTRASGASENISGARSLRHLPAREFMLTARAIFIWLWSKKATITFRLSFRPERWFMICPRTVRAFGRSVNLKSRNLCTNSDITNVGVSSRKITAGMPHSGFRLPE